MALHCWHRNNRMVLTNHQMAIRVNNNGTGTDLQWTSPVTIMHFSVTMTVENEANSHCTLPNSSKVEGLDNDQFCAIQ
eukprot:3300783-Amphidinium_carterae.1